MPKPDYSFLYAAPGRAYRDSSVVSHSHYRDPIDPACQDCGRSRVWGDASEGVQRVAIDALMSAGNRAGLSDRDMAHVLAIARHESGFNPSAAAGTTSAHGLGQFIDRTADHYQLTDTNRWDVAAQSDALVAHFQDNQRLAARRTQPDEAYIYKYHHDGPSGEYGGLDIARREVLPRLDGLEAFVRDHRAHGRQYSFAEPSFFETDDDQLAAGLGANAQRFEEQLGGRLKCLGMSELQIEALAAAASKEAIRHAGQGDVGQFLLNREGNTIAIRHEHPPLREFDVAQALSQTPQQHWQEAAALAQVTRAPASLHEEASPRAPGLAA